MGVIISSIWFVGFLACGYVTIKTLLPGEHVYNQLWLGAVAGLVCAMWLPSLAAFFLKFTVSAQLIALVIMYALALVAWRFRRNASPSPLPRGFMWILIVVIVFTVISAYLQYTHNLRPINGELHAGQSTFGDLNLHAGIATGLNGAAYPPLYTLLPNTRLSYPFLVDALSGSLYQLGMPLSWSLTIPGVIMSACVFYGFAMVAYAMTGSCVLSAIATALLFLNGGFGFAYTLDGIFSRPEKWGVLLNGFYQAPCNLVQYNIRWSNLIVDMLLPQRTFLAGWCVLFPTLWLLIKGMDDRSRGRFVALGILGGALPMIHTHSFFALGLISVAVFAWYAVKRDRDMLINMTIYGIIAVLLSLPQLYVWTFQQSGAEGFIRPWFNWVNAENGELIDGYFWFWLKNLGLIGFLLVPASFFAPKRVKPLVISAWLIFVVAECVAFQPNVYDNNKLFYVWYALIIPCVVVLAREIYLRLKGLPGIRTLLAACVLVCTLSAGLSIAREWVSDYMLYDANEVAAARWVEENTPKNTRFLTGTQHKNPISTLAGRSIICGTSSFLYYHGLDYKDAEDAAQNMMEHPSESATLFDAYGVEFVYISPYERSEWDVDEAYFTQYPVVFSVGDVEIRALYN